MSELHCIAGCSGPLAALDDDSGVTLYFCAQCRGTFCPGDAASRWLGQAALSLPATRAGAARCPADGAFLLALALPAGPTAFRCSVCAGLYLSAGALPHVRSLLPYSSAPPRPREVSRRPSAPAPSASVRAPAMPDGVLVSDRLAFDEPWVDLLALPAALLLSMLVMLTTLGKLLMYPVQIQFHELGHAIFAWLSSRAALPLPFGFTFWREEQSVFTGACMMFLLGLLGYRGLRERRPFAVVLAVMLLALFVVLSLVAARETSLMLMLAGGIAGELTLSMLVLVGFFFPMPDRLRWDFFRFILLVPAAGTWLSAAMLWRDVVRGTRPLPMGSILGTPGDGSGDLDRLIAEHDFTPVGLARGYLSLAAITGLVLLLTYGWFGLRAFAVLHAARTSQK